MTDNDTNAQQTAVPSPAPATPGVSPELTGGQGFSFEDAVAAVYAAALLCETTAPGLPARVVTRVSVQQGSLHQPLDDLIVRARGADLIEVTFSAQVKSELVVSAAQSNKDFRETIERAWRTVTADGFKSNLDSVGAIVGGISDAAKNTFQTLCEWARDESSTETFAQKLRTPGFAGDKLTHFEVVRNILSPTIAQPELDTAAHRLLAHFVLIRLEMLTQGSPIEAQTVALLSNALQPVDRPRVDDLWRRLLALMRVSEGRAASFDRKTLVARLNGAFRLSGAPSLSAAMAAITQETSLAAAEIANSISGLSIKRERHVSAILEAANSPGLLQISGLPGAGKSVVLRATAEQVLSSGPVLLLKSDRLQGKTWAQYASGHGLAHTNLEELLIEMEATGLKVLFIDGIDRVEVAHRGIVLDLLNTLLKSELLERWAIVATVRDTGAEHLRTWLPAELFAGPVRTVNVDSFDDDEAEALATAAPALRAMLFGQQSVRNIVRRPFFAAVLAKEVGASNVSATSEVDLAGLWWKRGGYSADLSRVQQRRNALVRLAKLGAHQLGRRIAIGDIDPEAVTELEADGILRSVRIGHTVQFAHDIFFEWAFLQHLVGQEEHWVRAIKEVGEPPGLGRAVELFSQVELVGQENWAQYLQQLEGDKSLRSQWLRAWLAGPFALETFPDHASSYTAAVFEGNGERVCKLIAWYQAEKTQPNTTLLAATNGSELTLAQRMVYADLLGHPADTAAWARFCDWLLEHSNRIPAKAVPDVVSAFNVWQNSYGGIRNRISSTIVRTCLAWLYHIQSLTSRKESSTDYGAWRGLNDTGYVRDELQTLSTELRTIVLKAALQERQLVTQYVSDFSHAGRVERGALAEMLHYSPLLARVCPTELADITLRFLRKRLPLDQERHLKSEESYQFSRGYGSWDWDRAAIGDEGMFSPSAPTREPFHSLLEHAPDEGRRLVRDLSNHAIRAWRQLNRISHQREGTPLPLVLRFPWGRQVFWGVWRQYIGARGSFGPAAVNSGLMALEAWAFEQLKANVPADEVVQKVLEGHTSVGALAVAAAVSLKAQRCSPVTIPIATCQRIWHWDIQRQVQDLSTDYNPNLIGFFKPSEILHRRAVKAGNELAVRRMDIRSLATLMLLQGDCREEVSAAIQAFPQQLPFDYAEERDSPQKRSELLRTALIWAEVGRPENYHVELDEERSTIVVSLNNPQTKGPEAQKALEVHLQMQRNLSLLNLAYAYFKDRTLKESPSIEAAVETAKQLYSDNLFETGYPLADMLHQQQAAVAAVAAIVLIEGAEEHLQWAAEVCVRASMTPEVEFFGAGTALMHHPALFAAYGLGALLEHVDDEEELNEVRSLLTRLASHPYEEIAVAALQELLKVWATNPNVAWEAMRVVAELCQYTVQFELPSPESGAARYKYVAETVEESMRRIEKNATPAATLPTLPDPWLEVGQDEIEAEERRTGRTPPLPWKQNPVQLHGALLGKILPAIPIEVAVHDVAHGPAFIAWCESLAKWTLERIAPHFAANRRERDDSASYLFDWKRDFYRFLARVSLLMPSEQAARRFMEPLSAKDDETFLEMAQGFVRAVAGAITDSPAVPPTGFELLARVRGRTLACRSWGPHSRLENDLDSILREFFFSVTLDARAPVRFANGRWDAVGAIVELVAPIVAAHGSNAMVARYWMELCERSFEHYPPQHFVDSLEDVLGPQSRLTDWHDTQLPARLAGLIQRFSERIQPMPLSTAQLLLRALDRLVDLGDRRAAAIQLSEVFRSVRIAA